MRRLTTLACISACLLMGAAFGCEDDDGATDTGMDSGGAGDEGGGGSGAKGGTPNGGGAKSSAGEPGDVAGGGSGAGGEPGADAGAGGSLAGAGGAVGQNGGAGGGGPGGDVNACESFPVTVTLGPTIQQTVTGAIICLDACRITTNTYSDGDDACPALANGPRFFEDSSANGENFANLQSTWEWVSATAGTINADFKYSLGALPEGTEVTAVISSADQTEYTVVFTFEGGGELTVTSFTET